MTGAQLSDTIVSCVLIIAVAAVAVTWFLRR